eukprot:scaffold4088_cov80-Skeletonema_dohrnii-CCMP3373.AAC.1
MAGSWVDAQGQFDFRSCIFESTCPVIGVSKSRHDCVMNSGGNLPRFLSSFPLVGAVFVSLLSDGVMGGPLVVVDASIISVWSGGAGFYHSHQDELLQNMHLES